MIFDEDFFNSFITNSHCYLAHLPKETESFRQPELLSEHSALVFAYTNIIIQRQQLNDTINKLVHFSIPPKLNASVLEPMISDLFYKSIAFHDLGKVNPKFQKYRMKNNTFLSSVSHQFESQHSIIGVYIYLADFFAVLLNSKLNDEEQFYISNVALYLSYSIFCHHKSNLKRGQDDTIWNNKQLFDLKPFLSLFQIQLSEEQIEMYHNCLLLNANFDVIFSQYFETIKQNEDNFPLFALCKLNYSLLTASDYLATAHYMNGWSQMNTDFGIIDNTLKEKIISNVKCSKPYNKAVYDCISKNITVQTSQLIEPSNNNLNKLRKRIAIDVIQNIKNNTDRNLFYIEVPTGGGKTNVSMLALAELLKADKKNKLNKVFYVFPFTTLITQTYLSVSETLGLNVDEIAEIHSKASFQTGKYEDDYLNYLDKLFVNYPITMLSHIRFFDVLKTNNKETNYLLHRMANSVVIIDEMQSYSPLVWDEITYFINEYSRYFNMKFIVMSATLPKIGELTRHKGTKDDYVSLINDKSIYFNNNNFCNRVKFDYSLLDVPMPDKNQKTEYFIELKKFLIDKSRHYSQSNNSFPNSVYTIIEFIFKKSASEFYTLVKNDNVFFDEIYLLSGTILEPRKKEIIENLKSTELRKKKVLLITTQVVEAGVDIDMDLGFKDKSIIDSEEQLAGRINRNVNKPQCTLYLFNCDSENTLYGKDYRYEFAKELNIDEYKTILEKKNFDELYSRIIKKINDRNNSEYQINIKDLEYAISSLNYQNVDSQLELIQSLNDSVFVPIKIPIKFFTQEIKTLKEFNIPYDDVVDGFSVWDAYTSIIHELNIDFVRNKIDMKKLQSIMSNFVFSIFKGGNDYNALKTYGIEQYGYLFLESFSNIYSFENGIDTTKLKESNFI